MNSIDKRPMQLVTTKHVHFIRIACALLVISLGTIVFDVSPGKAIADDGLDEYNFAVGLYKKSRWSLAADSFRKFLKEHPKHIKVPFGRLYLGLTLVNLEKYEEARGVLRGYVKDYPNSRNLSDALYRIAECSYLMDDLKSAEKEFQAFFAKAPKDLLGEWAYPYLADTQLRMNKTTAAAATFQKSLELFPKGRLAEDAKFGLARSYEVLDKPKEAIDLYKQLAANLTSDRAQQAQLNLATLYFDSGDFTSAIQFYLELEQKFPQSPLVPLAQLNSGYTYYQLAEFRKAITRFDLAARTPEQAATANYWKGLCHKSLGEYPQAVGIFKASFAKNSDKPLGESILYQWADTELRNNRFEVAKSLFLDVVSRWPKGDFADDSLHYATEAVLLTALQAKEKSQRAVHLDEAQKLTARFDREYPKSGLRFHQELLKGRVLSAQGGSTKQAAAVAHFQKVLNESNIEQTKSQARLYLARTYQKLNDHAKVVETIMPLVDQIKKEGSNTEFIDALVLHAFSLQDQAETLLAQSRQLTTEADLLQAQSKQLLRNGDETASQQKSKLAEEKYQEAGRIRKSAGKTGQPAVESSALYLKLRADGSQADQALAIKVVCEAIRENKPAAIADLATLRTRHSQSVLLPNVLHRLAEIAYDDRDWGWSEELFTSLAETDKGTQYHSAGLSGLAWSQYKNQKYKQAAASFQQFVDAYPNDKTTAPQAAFQIGDSLLKDGQPEKAAIAYLDVVKKYDGTQDAYLSATAAARVFKGLEKTADADAAYELAYSEIQKLKKEERANLDRLLNEWALLNYEARKYERSDELFRRLVKEAPDSDLVDDARYSLAESDLIAGKIAEAKKVFQELQVNPKSDKDVQQDSLYRLISIAAEQDQWDEVLVSSQQMTSRFPQGRYRWDAMFYTGESQLQLDHPNDAKKILLLLKAEKENPAVAQAEWFPNTWVLLAEVSLQLKDYKDVIATVEEFESWDAESPFLYRAHEILGRTYKQQAKFTEARAAFQKVVKSKYGRRTKTAAKSQLFLADTYFLQKDYKTALKEFFAVYILYDFPEYQAPALFQAALCHELLDEWKKAVETYKDLLEEFPDSDKTKAAKVRLAVARKKAVK